MAHMDANREHAMHNVNANANAYRAITNRLALAWELGARARNVYVKSDATDIDFMATWNWLGATENIK